MAKLKLPPPGETPTHPGELLKEIVFPALDTSIAEIARLLGLTRPAIYNLMSGKTGVSPEMALKLGKLIGNGPDFWLRMQARYDLAQAQQRIGAQVDAIPTLAPRDAA